MIDNQFLINAATQARSNAYAPYSGYAVGAALLTEDGQVFTGCNIENSAYGSTMCAERVALFKARSEGYQAFTAMAIVVDAIALPMPCGSCRQVMAELAPNIVVIVANISGDRKEYKVADLLPYAFTQKNFKENGRC